MKIKKIVLFVFAILIVLLLFSEIIYSAQVDFETIEKKSLEAREILKKENLGFRRENKKSNSRIVSRDIVFAVYLPETDIKVIRLEVAVPKSLRDNSFKFKVLTSGFNVERLTGKGITRLEFGVDGFVVLDSRHLHLEKSRTSPRDLFYAPYSDFFQDEYFTKKGSNFYKNIMRESQEELCATGAKSKSYPEKLLCEVFPDHWLLTLGAIEQMDDGEFFKRPKYSVKKFLAHIARNGENAFYYSVSQDGARGLMQFMNSKKYPTYNQTKKDCPEIDLIADFEKGTADMKNSIKFAICLADSNLSKMPKSAKEEFLEDPFKGGEAVAAAHNGGLGRALNFLKGKKIPKETQNFIKKYKETWKILERL